MSPVSIWSLLQADHDEIWDLLAAISGGADAPPDSAKRQRHLAKQLVAVQSAHEFAEERVVLPLVRAHCAEGAELAEEVLSQEKLLKRSLNELMAFAAGTPEFEECVNTIAGENRNH